MIRLLARVAPAILLVLPAAVLAAPFTDNLDDIVTEVGERLDALTGDLTKEQQKEKKTLLKLGATLDADSGSLGEDLKAYGKVAKSLAKLYPADLEIEFYLGIALDGFASDIQQGLNQITLLLIGVPEGKLRDKVVALQGRGQLALAAGNAETGRLKRAKLYAKAEKARLKANLLLE